MREYFDKNRRPHDCYVISLPTVKFTILHKFRAFSYAHFSLNAQIPGGEQRKTETIKCHDLNKLTNDIPIAKSEMTAFIIMITKMLVEKPVTFS